MTAVTQSITGYDRVGIPCRSKTLYQNERSSRRPGVPNGGRGILVERLTAAGKDDVRQMASAR